MPKLSNKPLTATDLLEYIAQDDFAFELSVYNLAHKLGFAPRHSGSYVDPVTGKHRQYDIHAWFKHTHDDFGIALAIECKSLRDSYPLLISRIPRTHDESFHDVISCNKLRF